MNTLRISGNCFPERPPNLGKTKERAARYAELVASLEHAAGLCAEVDRSLYKSIREAQSHAMNLHRRAVADSPGGMRLPGAGTSERLPYE